MITYCVSYTPAGDYPDPRQIMAHREFVDDVHTKREAMAEAKRLYKAGALMVYVDQYRGEIDDEYAELINYWHVNKNGAIV